MKKQSWMSVILLMALLTVFTTGCRVRQTEEGKLPDVDVSAEGGKMPEYDVDPAKVEVSTDTQKVVTPQVEVTPAGEGESK